MLKKLFVITVFVSLAFVARAQKQQSVTSRQKQLYESLGKDFVKIDSLISPSDQYIPSTVAAPDPPGGGGTGGDDTGGDTDNCGFGGYNGGTYGFDSYMCPTDDVYVALPPPDPDCNCSYTWSAPGGTILTTNPNTKSAINVRYTSAGVFTVTGNGNCPGGTARVVQTVYSDFSVTRSSVSPGNSNFCTGDNVPLSVTTSTSSADWTGAYTSSLRIIFPDGERTSKTIGVSNSANLSISTSQIFGTNLPTAPIRVQFQIVTRRNGYACSNTYGSTSGAIYFYPSPPVFTNLSSEAPDCPSDANEGSITFSGFTGSDTNVIITLTSLTQSCSSKQSRTVYRKNSTVTKDICIGDPLEVLNFELDISGGAFTLDSNSLAKNLDSNDDPINPDLAPGIYEVIIEVGEGYVDNNTGLYVPATPCFERYYVEIPERPCISEVTNNHVDIDNNSSVASTKLVITGGTKPFNYSTSLADDKYIIEENTDNGNTEISIYDVESGGTYNFSLTDDLNYPASEELNFYDNRFTLSDLEVQSQTDCDGLNGSLGVIIDKIDPSNFNSSLSASYSWSEGSASSDPPLATSNTLDIAEAGKAYYLSVEYGTGNASSITNNSNQLGLYPAFSVVLDDSNTDEWYNCDAESGKAKLTIGGSTGTYDIKWTGPSITSSNEDKKSITGLKEGDYSYVVKSLNTDRDIICTKTGTVTVDANFPSFTENTTERNEGSCSYDDSHTEIEISNGFMGYDGDYTIYLNGVPGLTYYSSTDQKVQIDELQGSEVFISLKKNSGSGCMINLGSVIMPGYSSTFSYDVNTPVNPGCYDDGGSINFSLIDGDTNKYYYDLLVREQESSCDDDCPSYVNTDLNDEFTVELVEVGTPEFDASNITIENIKPDPTNTYILEVSDGSCTYYHEFSFASAPDQPTFTGITSPYQLTCYGDVQDIAVDLSDAEGTVSNFSFNLERKLTAGGTYSDYADFDPTNITSTSLTISDLPVGYYKLSGEDGNNCVFAPVEFQLDQPSAPFEIVSTDPRTQYTYLDTAYHVINYREPNGSIIVEAQGGQTNYTFELYRNGAQLNSQTKTGGVNEVKTFTGLYASDGSGGIYNYTVKAIDNLTCDTTSTALTLREPALLELDFWLNKYANSADTFNIKCNGGADTVFVQASGGIPNYSVRLENLDNSSVVTQPLTDDGDIIYFAGLSAGNYQLSLTDKINTAATFSKTISSAAFELKEPSAITYTTEMVEPTCFGGNDGSYTVKPLGGVPYALGEYLIKFYDENKVELNAYTSRASSATLVSDSGSYYYTVQDTLDGCSVIYHAFDIVEWPRLMIDTLVTEYPLCYGDSTAKLNVYVKDGRPLNDTYGVALYDSTNSRVDSLVTDANGYTLFEDLFSGEYYVTVYDSALCSYKDTIYVEERTDPLEISQTEKQASTCANSDNAKLKVYSAGGDVMHYYSIDNGASWRTPEPGNIYVGADNKVDSAFVVFDSLESGGIYEIWLKDSNYYDESFDGSCLISKTDTISTTPELVLDWEKENVSCYDAADGSITLAPSFGIDKDLSYFDISITKNGTPFAENTLTLTDLSYGLYEVELSLSAADACPTVLNEEIFIERPDSPLTAQVQSTSDYNCANPEAIVIRGTVEGGWPKNGYDYKVNEGSFKSFVPEGNAFRFTEQLLIGAHELTIRDSIGCEYVTAFTVEPLTFYVEVLKQTDVSCYGGNDGLLQLTSANGNLAYKLWNSTDSFKIAATDTALFDAVPTGNFQLVASSGSCISDTLNFTFNSPDEITIDYNIINQPTCGEANGEVVTNINGGVEPYTTNWLYKGGQLLAADALMAGDYIVIVEDAMGCQKRDSVYLEEQTDLSATVADISRATCGAANASVTLNITGGVPGYIIEWYNSQNALVGNGSLLSNISKGTYYYQLSDQSGCAITDTVFVGGDEALSVSIANATQASCGIANGSVSLSVTGGNAPYEVSWPSAIPVTNGLSASGLKGGIVYEVLVTDSIGCEKNFKFSIDNSSGPELSINQFNPSCGLANGIIEITSATGKEPLSITWNGVADTSRLKTGLGEGTYSITVTDADSCSTTKVVELEEDLSNQLTVSNSITPSTCGGSNGIIELNIRGGFAPYQISWDDNASITESQRTNLAAGTYEVTVTDSVGCEISKSIVLNEVASPLLSVESFVQASCGTANGSIVLSELSNDYVYHWSHDGGITTNSAEGLSAGKYDIYAENGSCTTDTLSFYITSPGTDLNISVVETVAATCETTYDGAAEINISGGASPYTISWNDEQNQNVERASNLLPDTYTVLVTDASGCSAVKSVTVGSVNPVYIAGFNSTAPSCYTATDGSIEVVVTGGTGNYSYLWSTGASSKTLTDVAAGTYSVEVFDNGECAVNESVTLIAPDSLSLQASVAAPRCYESANGSAELSINGGTAPYSISWSDGNTSLRRYDLLAGAYNVEITDDKGCLLTQVVTVPEKDSVTIAYNIEHASCYNASDANIEITAIGNARSPLVKWSNGQRGTILRNVTAGTYTANITDANACVTSFSFTVTQPDLLAIENETIANAKCAGASNGSITYEVVGGTAPYTYRWSDGAISKHRTGLAAGTYEVLITDASGCAIAESFEIGEPVPLAMTTELAGVSCFGSADGQAIVEVNGGTAPYQISWPDGGTTFTREDLTAGRYDVTITDANNCSLTQRLTIDNINPIEIESISRDIPSCYQASDGSISIEVAGGSGDYTISWENGAQGATVTNIAAGTYAVTITDGNGCTFNGSIRLDDAAPINISQLIVADPICYDEPSGMVSVSPSGGSAPYKVIWEDGVEALERTDLLAGTHNFTIQDAEGCTTAYEVTLENPPLEELSNLPEIVYLCTGGYITLDAGNWDTYSWTSDNTFSSTEREVRIDAEGNYHIEVTNEAGYIDAHDIEVIKDDDLLQADFLLTSEAVVGDTVLIIDISWPMPGSVEWFNPDDKDFYLVSQEGDYQQVIFTRTGEFEMSMKANLDQCEAYVTKTINVLSQDEAARKRAEAASKSQGKLHLSTNIYPNPNYGTFRLEVEGNQQHDIDVRIVDLHKGYEYYQLSGKQQQKHVFNITDDRLPAGVYIAIIETKKQTITKRFVVK